MQKSASVIALYKAAFTAFFIVFSSIVVYGQNPNRDHADFPVSVLTYYLPSGQNGLAETSFKVSARVFLHRWEKSTTIEVFLHWTNGTSRTLDPAFKFDYVFQGVHYGDQHLGKEAFDDITVGSVIFKTVIMFGSQIINFESSFSSGSEVGRGPVDLEASDVKVFIKGISSVEFNRIGPIENKIIAIRDANKKKENYAKLIKEADQNMSLKKWQIATEKYETASGIFPNEAYPKTQLTKIKEQKKLEEESKQAAVKKETYTKLIKEADQYMSQKNWASAQEKYQEATELNPSEGYPKSQLNKIKELKNAEIAKAEQGSNSNSTSKTNSSETTNKSNTNSGSSSSSNAISSKSSSTSGQVAKSSYNQANANLPKYGRDNAGRYYEKDANNNYQEVSFEQYQQGKNSELKQKQEQAQAIVDAKNAQIVKDAQAKAQAFEDGLFKNMNTDPAKEAQKWANQQQSFYAAQSVSSARSSVDKNSRLSGNYNSVQEIEAEFNQKYRSINTDVRNLQEAKNQKLQADYNTAFYGADQKGQAIGQLAVGIGTLINEASAAREARKAREALEEQRRAEIAKIEEKKRQARIEIRNKLFSQFPDGGLPLSSHNIMSNEVYFFSYVFDKNTIDKENAVIYVSNLFPISKYGDGSWPFKSSVLSEIGKISPSGPITVMGYYTTSSLASQMLSSFRSLSEKSGLVIKDITYKGKKASGTNTGNTDFWGNSTNNQKSTSIKQVQVEAEKQMSQPQATPKLDFWGNPIKSNASDSSTKIIKSIKQDSKKEVKLDFWGNPIKQ